MKKINYYLIGSILIIVAILAVWTLFFKNAKEIRQSEENRDVAQELSNQVSQISSPAISSNSSEDGNLSYEIDKEFYKDETNKYVNAGDYKKAQELIDTVLKFDSKDSEFWFINSLLEAKVGDLNKAISFVDKAISYNSVEYSYWKWKLELISRSLIRKGVLNDSEEYKNTINNLYLVALEKTKNHIEIIMPYAIFLEEIGEKENAIKYWQLAIKVNPLAKLSYQSNIDRLSQNQ